jgi:CBS domain-containing protein
MTMTAAEIMTKPVITVTPEANIADIVAVLASKHISAVPVCGPDGTLAGIVTEGDVLKPFRESVRKRRDWWLGILAEGEELPQALLDYMRRDTRSAADIMARHVISADRAATLPALAELMMANGIKRIPIVSDGRVVGIVSRADMIAALARAPAMLV